ncbi:MAG: Crp/Fnr family transcriptional regulator [Acidobacteria bacterium]|nr:MAG: Crp/Fnr family transcriptional regulator [Acidobacteriota bacterium]
MTFSTALPLTGDGTFVGWSSSANKEANTTMPAAPRPRNRLLAALPPVIYARIAPLMKTVPMRRKQILHTQGLPIDHVYFPNGGVCSVMTMLADGSTIEVTTIGDEGFVGLDAFFGPRPIAHADTVVQVEDADLESLSVAAFRRELARQDAFQELMGQYAQVAIAQIMQTTACNAVHDVQQRCCRWLLMTHDRVHQNELNLSHEFLAAMLGVRRPTVSLIAGALQHAGAIRYHRGVVNIVDRAQLERRACECYAAIRGQFERLPAA